METDLFQPLMALRAQHDHAVKALSAAKQEKARIGSEVERMTIVWRNGGYGDKQPEGIGLKAVREVIADARTRAEELADEKILECEQHLLNVRMAIRRQIVGVATQVEQALVAAMKEPQR